jgi:hypothetical protein
MDGARTGERPRVDINEIRVTHPKAYDGWTDDDDALLVDDFRDGRTIEDLAHTLQRQPSAIESRLKKLALRILMVLPELPHQW